MQCQITTRKYRNSDCDKISELFYRTIRSVNAKDYTAEQLNAWANNTDSLKLRRNDLLTQNTLIAEINGEITGFGSITSSGCLDLIYVREDFQGQGIATKLCNELERNFPVIVTYASITAKPFFEKRGYVVLKEREVERFGVKLKNFQMQKKNATRY